MDAEFAPERVNQHAEGLLLARPGSLDQLQVHAVLDLPPLPGSAHTDTLALGKRRSHRPFPGPIRVCLLYRSTAQVGGAGRHVDDKHVTRC